MQIVWDVGNETLDDQGNPSAQRCMNTFLTCDGIDTRKRETYRARRQRCSPLAGGLKRESGAVLVTYSGAAPQR
jgi:hypothetical protein